MSQNEVIALGRDVYQIKGLNSEHILCTVFQVFISTGFKVISKIVF